MKKIYESKHIVFCFEHYNPLGIIRSLGENGIKPIVIIIKGKERIASYSKYISNIHFVNSIDEGYKILMQEYSNEISKPFLYTADDKITSFLDENYDILKNKFYFYNAGEQGKLNYYMEKVNISNLAKECGLNVAKMWIVKNGEIPDDIEFPIITKACNSKMDNWKSEVHICHNKTELKNAYKEIRSKKIILQKYIVKKNEIAISGVSVNRGNDILYSMEINFKYLLDDTYSFYMTVKNFNSDDITEKTNTMLKKIGFEGIFEIEFLLDNNDNKFFLEINFRPTAWNYASTIAGMPMPIIWSQGMINEKNVKSQLKIYKEFNAISELSDFKIRVKGKKVNIFKWFYQLFTSKCIYIYNIRYLKPFIIIILNKFKRK